MNVKIYYKIFIYQAFFFSFCFILLYLVESECVFISEQQMKYNRLQKLKQFVRCQFGLKIKNMLMLHIECDNKHINKEVKVGVIFRIQFIFEQDLNVELF
eukprot:TRINITY_DN540_c0_g1_i10.p3 TRINITY_DN540_c0_g1~~TRINITY_DN540_c0_g1_i10.p3  ORF type:complete len:100 (-),score=1.50 TRINITY_DN540_c0_g1_i10:70-369(-)